MELGINAPFFCCDWVLCLDADQRVTPELRYEIGSLLADGTVPQMACTLKGGRSFAGSGSSMVATTQNIY